MGARDDDCLSDIDENAATTTILTSAGLDVSQTKTSAVADSVVSGDTTSWADSTPVHDASSNVGRETDGSSQVPDVRPVDKVDDAVRSKTSVTESSTESAERQTRSTVDVDVSEMVSVPRRSQSLRLYRVRSAAARGDRELDAAVHEFQARAAPEREALRNRLRKLSLIYADAADEASRTWPASRRPSADVDPAAAAAAAGCVTPTAAPLRRDEVLSTASSSTSTLQLKYGDSDSLSSQKDEGFETASISSDVYLSSSQRSSMCDCDGALATAATLERRSDPTTTAGNVEPQSETFPPPPASFLDEPEVNGGADTGRSSGDGCDGADSVVLPPVELASVLSDARRHPSSDASVVRAKETRLGVDCAGGRDALPSGAKQPGSVRRAAQAAAGTRQARTAAAAVARPAPATPRRASSLIPSFTSRGVRSAAAATNHQPAGRGTPAAVRTPAAGGVAAASSTSTGLPAPFRRTSSLMTTDVRAKSTAGARIAAALPPPAFVRQSQTRATIAAPVLRSNKRAAAEARKAKAAAAATGSEGPSFRPTTAATSASSGPEARPQRGRCRTSSGSSCSSTTAVGGGPKSAVGRRTCPTAAGSRPLTNVPCAALKKHDGASANVRRTTQPPPSSRLRAPVITKQHCT